MHALRQGGVPLWSWALVLFAAGCHTPRMVVPTDVAKVSEEIVITDRSILVGSLVDESFKMEPYAITDVDRAWNNSSEISLLGFSSRKSKGGYAYVFKGGAEKRKGGCITEDKAEDLSVKAGAGVNVSASDRVARLGCRCLMGGRQAKVILEARDGARFAGTVEAGGAHYRITGIYESKGTLGAGGLSGYRVDGDAPAGAVEVFRPGRVWLSRELEGSERADLACLFAGLLLGMPR